MRPTDSEAVPEYLQNVEGEYAVDPANPDARATHVLTILVHANRAAYGDDEDDSDDDNDNDYDYDYGYDNHYDYDDDPDW
jgi:hypothetical protein